MFAVCLPIQQQLCSIVFLNELPHLFLSSNTVALSNTNSSIKSLTTSHNPLSHSSASTCHCLQFHSDQESSSPYQNFDINSSSASTCHCLQFSNNQELSSSFQNSDIYSFLLLISEHVSHHSVGPCRCKCMDGRHGYCLPGSWSFKSPRTMCIWSVASEPGISYFIYDEYVGDAPA